MMEILIYVLILWLGVIIGFFIRALFGNKSSGTIYVTQNAEKTLYSLELDEYPEELRFKKEIVFKVDSSEIIDSFE
jgi:hypothetical protein